MILDVLICTYPKSLSLAQQQHAKTYAECLQ